MVFHVTRGQMLAVYPFEFLKQHRRQFAQRIHQHIQSASVRHTNHRFFDTQLTRAFQQMIEQRDQGITAF